MSLPDEKQIERAIHYLTETDKTFADLKAAVGALEHGIKIAEALGYLQAEGPQEARKAAARSSNEYRQAVDEWENCKAEFHLIENKRNRATTEIDVWRSLNANQRRA